MSNPVIDRLNHLLDGFDARVAATAPDQWTAPAPCDGWQAVDVVEHVAGSSAGMAAGLSGSEPLTLDRADPAASWAAISTALRSAVASADLSQNMPGPFGPMPAEQLIGRFLCMDLLVHTWDLARATGGDEQLDTDIVEAAYSGLKPMDAMIRQPGFFGPRIDPADGDDVQTEFLKFLGRTV
jgi:uncharacterized protein (TIGR03086 family)